jgi:hypothetical protein
MSVTSGNTPWAKSLIMVWPHMSPAPWVRNPYANARACFPSSLPFRAR